jgi:hypothetical protein
VRGRLARHRIHTLFEGVRPNPDGAQIAKLPDGVYRDGDDLEIFGPARENRLEPLLLPSKLTASGDVLTVDLTGAAERGLAPAAAESPEARHPLDEPEGRQAAHGVEHHLAAHPRSAS